MVNNVTDTNIVVLLLQENSGGSGAVRQALGDGGHGFFRLQPVESVSTALARIGGGGVRAVVVDLPAPAGSHDGRLDSFLKLRSDAPHIPVILLCDTGDEVVALRAMRSGASKFIMKNERGDGLGAAVRTAVELARHHAEPQARQYSSRPDGVIVFLGAKGGVGTSTVAVNVAAFLARRGTVIAVEMHPESGSLSCFFGTPGLHRNLSRLLERMPAAIGRAEVRGCLWPCKDIPGLSILFAPQNINRRDEISVEHAGAIIKALVGMADFVIIDLPASLSLANRAIIEAAGFVALVLERDPLCVQMAKSMTKAIRTWDASPQLATIVVNRAVLSFPMALVEVDKALGYPALGVILPEPDLCLRAQNAGSPLVIFQPESLLSQSLVTLGERLADVPAITGRFGRAGGGHSPLHDHAAGGGTFVGL